MQRTRTDLERAAAQAGGVRLLDVEPCVLPDGTVVLSGRFAFEDPWAAARLLQVLSDEDAADPDPDVAAWARAIYEECDGDPDLFARALQANVRDAIAFEEETGEQFQNPRTTMLTRKGDCDCQARLLYVMAWSQGLPAVLRFFEQGGEPTHVADALETSEGMQWAETTIDADFGEHPQDAYRRLGLDVRGERADLGDVFATTQHDHALVLQTRLSDLYLQTAVAVNACPQLTAQQTTQWEDLAKRIVAWNSLDPANADLTTGTGLAKELIAWSQTLTAAGCSAPVTTPLFPQQEQPAPTPSPWPGLVKTVAIAVAVAAAAALGVELARTARVFKAA